MKRLMLIVATLAFLIGLTDGNRVLIPYAVGFGIGEYEGIGVHVFFDKDAKVLKVIPSEAIAIAIYKPDDVGM